jgi:hypothetical protein
VAIELLQQSQQRLLSTHEKLCHKMKTMKSNNKSNRNRNKILDNIDLLKSKAPGKCEGGNLRVPLPLAQPAADKMAVQCTLEAEPERNIDK